MEWNVLEISSLESAVLGKHCLAFVFVVLFFSRWLPRRKTDQSRFLAELRDNRTLVIFDIAFGVLFVFLLVVSVVLLLFPQNTLSCTDPEPKLAKLQGYVSDQWIRPYLWAPDSAGSYVVISGKQLYVPEIQASLIGTKAEVSFLPEHGYALRLTDSASAVEDLSDAWYLSAGRWLMVISGVYLAIRLGYYIGLESLAEKKRQDKTNPLADFLNRL